MAVLIISVTTAALCDNKQNLQMITTDFFIINQKEYNL
jgi:hypothetical protein